MNNSIAQEGASVEDCEDKDKIPPFKLGPEVTTFLKSLLNMTQCPISHARFTEPLSTPGRYIYEGNEIVRWLRAKMYLHLQGSLLICTN